MLKKKKKTGLRVRRHGQFWFTNLLYNFASPGLSCLILKSKGRMQREHAGSQVSSWEYVGIYPLRYL